MWCQCLLDSLLEIGVVLDAEVLQFGPVHRCVMGPKSEQDSLRFPLKLVKNSTLKELSCVLPLGSPRLDHRLLAVAADVAE